MPERNPPIAGVRFRNAGKIFYFHTAGMRLEPGEYVVVESSRGPEVGRVVISPEQVVVNELGNEELRPILRLATDDDIRRADGLGRRAQELLPEARRLAGEAGFPARIDTAEFTLDGRRLTFAFTSEDRLDYRDFVRKASDRFGVKVDLRQIGARDRAKAAGGYGICGRELCCANWLATFPSISIRMAKEQELPLNPQKISGLCGRLLCCLSYEEEGYKEMRRSLPKVGQRCSTPTGEGKVVSINILRRQVTLIVDGQRIEVGDRDLGTVVRWDTSSKSGTPPPSITRAEAIEQGLIEATEEDLAAAERGWEEPEPAFPTAGRGRLPSQAPRKQAPARSPLKQPPGQAPSRPESRRPDRRDRPERSSSETPPAPGEGGGRRSRRGGGAGGGQRPQGPPPASSPPPAGRVFRRAEPAEGQPRPPRGEDQPQQASQGESGEGPGGSSRRRRRGRGRGGNSPASGGGAE